MTTQSHAPTSAAAVTETPVNPAETYERYMVPVVFAPAAARLLDAARVQPGERVLDVGTGTGIVARRAAPRVGAAGRVAAVDVSAGMLAVARQAAAGEGVAIDWHEGRAEDLPFANETFDVALSQFALMFFSDRDAALCEMRRVLAPGGRVAHAVFQGIDRHPFYQALDQAIARRLGTSAVSQIFALGDAGALRDALAGAGFHDVTVEPYTLVARFPNPEAFLAGEIDVDTAAIPAMQGLDPTARRELTAALQEDMAAPLGAVTVGDEVHMPFHAQIARGRR